MSDHNAIRTTAKEAKHGGVLYTEGDELGHGESECGYWRERDLGDGRILLEWVDEKDADKEAAEDESRACTGIRGRDWLAPTPPRQPKRDWLALPPPDSVLAPSGQAAGPKARLARTEPLPRHVLASLRTALARLLDESQRGRVGLPVVGRMLPFNEWTEVRSAKEGNFFEQFAPGSLSKSIRERGATIEEMWEREDGAHYRSRLLEGVPELVVSGLRAGLYGSSVSFRARRFERVSHPRRRADNPGGLEERTITEADVYEFSFVTFPQYVGATARVEET